MSAEEKQDATFSAAKQLYAEQFGDAIVTNTYLKLALLAMAVVSAGLIYANVKTVRMVENFKPLVYASMTSAERRLLNTTPSATSLKTRRSNTS